MLSPGDRSAIQQQQQQLLDENQRQRDALERSAPLTITPSPETSAGTEGPCFTVSSIVVSGATRLTSAETVNATIFNRYLPFSCPLRYFRY